eukprot:TRINITY_DN13439_c0_g1_i2.p1 TRINITY_DN13439_c0_g1~~TRINITY_DN13439_c0_g1_i2.p1  ORF type:complete len:210 (+),score=39.68 TRINITY_DN13439_c0_g1_i2:97-726(+)
MKCMTYFPVVIKTSHLAELRRYVVSIHGKSWHEVFRSILARPNSSYSQFNFMCNFVWHFHRDEYNWHLQEHLHGWNESLDGQISPQELTALASDPVLTTPKARVSIHAPYSYKWGNGISSRKDSNVEIRHWAVEGYCRSRKMEPKMCKSIPNSGPIQKSLFQFEFSEWLWDDRCKKAHDEHYADVYTYLNTHNSTQIWLENVLAEWGFT